MELFPAHMTRTIRAPRGNQRTAQGWIQEAAKRMLMNNLDPEVAERPEDLVVYGGLGKAARNWDCFHAIVKEDPSQAGFLRQWLVRAAWGASTAVAARILAS